MMEIMLGMSEQEKNESIYAVEMTVVSAVHQLINTAHFNITEPWDVAAIEIHRIHNYNFLHFPIDLIESSDALPPLGRKLLSSLFIEDVKK